MSETTAPTAPEPRPSTELVPVPLDPQTALAREMMNDDTIRIMFRIADALYASKLYADVNDANQAFAKMLVGRDLGISPTQSLGALHLVEGNIQVHYAMLGHFVRSRPGYSYRPGWLKPRALADGELPAITSGGETVEPVEVVWMDEEDPADLREIVGAVIDFSVNGERRGVSRYTVADANRAGLIKPDKPKSAWMAARPNMLLARSMSNGVKWFVPEVASGLPLYVAGEVDERPSLTAPTGSGEAQGIDLGPKVDAIIERAQALGHAGLADRASLELLLGSRAPDVVKDWVRKANAELDRMEAEQAEAEQAKEEADATLAADAEAIASGVEVAAGAED